MGTVQSIQLPQESLFKILRKVRPYQAFTVITIGLILVVLYQSEFGPTESFRADNWAQVSISVGATALTVVAIIASIVVSNENKKRTEMRDSLTSISNRIMNKKQVSPDRSYIEIYEDSIQKLAQVIDQISPLKYGVSVLGLLSFFLFLFSAIFAIMGNPFKLIIGSFLVGVALLSGYVIYVIEEFLVMDKFSSYKKRKGELTLLAHKINGVSQTPNVKDKKGTISTNRKIERIEFKLRFNGNVRNGFLHASVRYENGLFSYVPDANTFLATFGFTNDFRLVLLEREFDTGILQTKGNIDLPFELILRSIKDSEINPPIANAYVERLGMQTIYKHCSIPSEFKIKAIELSVFEDPFYQPNYKRSALDCITLEVTETEYSLTGLRSPLNP